MANERRTLVQEKMMRTIKARLHKKKKTNQRKHNINSKQ